MDTVQGSVAATDYEFPTRISARGVIAGVLVALALAILLMVFGAAIGFTAFRPSGDVAKGLGIGFAAWLLLSLIVSAFFGGWVASGAARAIRGRDGLLHGLVTWAAVTLIGFSLVGGAVRSTLKGILGVGQTAAQAAVASPAANRAATEGNVQQQIGNAVGNLSANPQQLTHEVTKAAGGAAIGTWGLFAALLLPMVAGLGGGVLGAGRERHAAGLTVARPRRRRVAEQPARSTPIPSQPLPST